MGIKSLMTLLLILVLSPILKGELTTLNQLFDYGYRGNTKLKSIIDRKRAIELSIEQNRALKNPEIELEVENPDIEGISFGVSHSIEFSQKIDGREAVIRGELSSLMVEELSIKREIEIEILEHLYPIIRVNEEIQLQDSLISIVSQLKDRVSIRIRSGAAKEVDLLRLEVEEERLNLTKKDLIRSKDQQIVMLKDHLQLGRNFNLNIALPHSFENIEQYSLEESSKRLNNYYQFKEIEQEQNLLILEQNNLRSELTPDLGYSLKYGRNFESETNSFTLSLSTELPIFNRNRKGIEALEATKSAITKKSVDMVKDLNYQLNDIYLEMDLIKRRVEDIEGSLIPKFDKVTEILDRYFDQGKLSIFEIIENRKERVEILEEIQLHRYQLALKSIDIFKLTGVTPKIFNNIEIGG